MAREQNFERFGAHLERLAGIASLEIQWPSYSVSVKIVSSVVPRDMRRSGVPHYGLSAASPACEPSSSERRWVTWTIRSGVLRSKP